MADLEDDDPNALESTERASRVRLAGAVHKDHAPRPLVVLDPNYLGPAVQAIRDEVRRLQRVGASSFLYVDERHQVYVVSELRSVAALWVKEHFGWLVAVYAARRKDNGSKKNDDGSTYLAATIEGITEDLQQHLADLSRPKP